MIWHDHIFIDGDPLNTISGDDVPLDNLTHIRQFGVRGVEGAAPYDLA